MEFLKQEWLGSWVNFENYIYSEETNMKQCWSEAEEAAKNIPMFQNGAKSFWEMACNTINAENPVRLYGWNIEATDTGMAIEWLGESKESLGKYNYTLSEMIPKGLEAKENFLFEATDAPTNWPFRLLLAMAPMPERSAKNNGGLLSHLHFQYASSMDKLLQNGKLCNPMWYATMCDGKGSLLDCCNIVRALHRMPVWKELPV